METIAPRSHHIHNEKINAPNKKIKKKANKLRKNKNRNKTHHDSSPPAYSYNDVHAEPMIRSAWAGGFNLRFNNEWQRTINGVSGYLSTKSCEKVWDASAQLQEIVQFELVRKASVWPESFKRLSSVPGDDNIALYFFPTLMKNEGAYDQLVFEMMNGDLAMKASVQNAELLVFTSVELLHQFWRYQGRFYLWGVFREKKL